MATLIEKESFFECEDWHSASAQSSGYASKELLKAYARLNESNFSTPEIFELRHIELFSIIESFGIKGIDKCCGHRWREWLFR